MEIVNTQNDRLQIEHFSFFIDASLQDIADNEKELIKKNRMRINTRSLEAFYEYENRLISEEFASIAFCNSKHVE